MGAAQPSMRAAQPLHVAPATPGCARHPWPHRRRMEFALRTAYAQGTSALRTHLINMTPKQIKLTWPVFARLRDEWAGKVGGLHRLGGGRHSGRHSSWLAGWRSLPTHRLQPTPPRRAAAATPRARRRLSCRGSAWWCFPSSGTPRRRASWLIWCARSPAHAPPSRCAAAGSSGGCWRPHRRRPRCSRAPPAPPPPGGQARRPHGRCGLLQRDRRLPRGGW